LDEKLRVIQKDNKITKIRSKKRYLNFKTREKMSNDSRLYL